MNCSHCHNKIDGKSWLHLSNLPSMNEEGKNIFVDKHICSYSCYKRLYDSNSIPTNFSSHIVNKEDYKDLIRPIPIQKQKEFNFEITDHRVEMVGLCTDECANCKKS